MALGEMLKRIADGQASPTDYVDAGKGAAGAVPAARAVSAVTGMASKITNLINRLKPQLRNRGKFPGGGGVKGLKI